MLLVCEIAGDDSARVFGQTVATLLTLFEVQWAQRNGVTSQQILVFNIPRS